MGMSGKCENSHKAENALDAIAEAINDLRAIVRSEQEQKEPEVIAQGELCRDGFDELRRKVGKRAMSSNLRFPTGDEFSRITKVLLQRETVLCARIAEKAGYPSLARMIKGRIEL